MASPFDRNDVAERVAKLKRTLKDTRGLCHLGVDVDLETVVCMYLALRETGKSVALVPFRNHASWIEVEATRTQPLVPLVLLTTSGTTNTSKFVKLTHANLNANSAAIRKSLGILKTDVAGMILSPAYSYGLSVVNTHMDAGAKLYAPAAQFLSKLFWKQLSDNGVTSLALVPSHLEAMHGRSLGGMLPKTLRYVTVAGGRVTDKAREVLEDIRGMGIATYVMYGQTEATARITCLHSDDYDRKPGSVGKAIDGKLSIDDGEVVYEGPNVFAGYASCANDLIDVKPVKRLYTGDLGRIDDEGFLWITGRKSRIAKVNSQRVSLDEVEQRLESNSRVQVRCVSDDEFVYAFSAQPLDFTGLDAIKARIRHITMEKIPVSANGKTDYSVLIAHVGHVQTPA